MCYNVATVKQKKEMKKMKANNKKVKDVCIRCRVDRQARDNFNAACARLGINGSDWLRQQIYKFIATAPAVAPAQDEKQ